MRSLVDRVFLSGGADGARRRLSFIKSLQRYAIFVSVCSALFSLSISNHFSALVSNTSIPGAGPSFAAFLRNRSVIHEVSSSSKRSQFEGAMTTGQERAVPSLIHRSSGARWQGVPLDDVSISNEATGRGVFIDV